MKKKYVFKDFLFLQHFISISLKALNNVRVKEGTILQSFNENQFSSQTETWAWEKS